MSAKIKPAVLIVRDGWGRNPHPEHDAFNAVKLAATPRCDALLREYPWTLIHTSGENVGLPDGTMGNSEVGHQNLGAGRIVYQDSVAITVAIRNGEFFSNHALCDAVENAKRHGHAVHLMGIGSDVGVHGLLGHLYGCLELCKRRGMPADKVFIHLFTDGRDSGPYTGKDFLAAIEAKTKEIGVGRIVSVLGRYYAMDRDNRWERVKQAYDLLTGRGESAPRQFATVAQALADYYEHPINDSQNGDEFVTPRVIGADWQDSRVKDGDTILFYNYRGDRPREITRAFVLPDDKWATVKPSPDSGKHGFERGRKLDVHYVTLTAYETELAPFVHVAFPKPPKMKNIAGEFLAHKGLTQFRCAETEKFPHVTFFFNDYRDEPFPGESREMAQSPRVATYDLQPEMSAPRICELVLAHVNSASPPDFILVNFANGDMVGHTGKLDAAIKAVQTVDDCVGRIVDATLAKGGVLIVTADHGNAEQMFDPTTNAPHTAHTTYDVECILVDPRLRNAATGSPDQPSSQLRNDGRLADVFPTILDLLGLDKPAEMNGASLKSQK
ncbi:MAG: 2,3-bisphosphoglycerate-independent phosphoglycerate mutase [Phycisphaeraceae bacterium]